MSGTRPQRPDDVAIPRVDGLTIRGLLGRGGMGAVFEAREGRRGPRVAVKVIAFADATGMARARFATELDALEHIDHPHVVHLRRRGDEGGVPYAVLDRVSGFGLDQIHGGLPWRVAVYIGRQLAQAIAAVHRAGYVHRDIKPANVMVGRNGHVTLIDFGVATRQPAAGGATVTGERRSPLTMPGTCIGTPRFLAPEVVAGAPASVRSDLHGFGMVMAHLLRDLDDDEPPEELLDLVARCLEPDPALRPASADEIAAALAALPARRPHLRRSVFVGIALASSSASTKDTNRCRPFALLARRAA